MATHTRTLLFKIKWHLVEQQQQQQRKLCIDTTHTYGTIIGEAMMLIIRLVFGFPLHCNHFFFAIENHGSLTKRNAKEMKERENALCITVKHSWNAIEHINAENRFSHTYSTHICHLCNSLFRFGLNSTNSMHSQCFMRMVFDLSFVRSDDYIGLSGLKFNEDLINLKSSISLYSSNWPWLPISLNEAELASQFEHFWIDLKISIWSQ